MTALNEEAARDRARLAQWRAGNARLPGLNRRALLRLTAAGGLALAATGTAPDAASASGPIVKPLPPELFDVYGSNAETRWEALRGQGYLTPVIECAGNGRSFFTSQQGQSVSGTAWKLGAVGVARWRGVRLATVLARAGLTHAAVDVLPEGLDPDYVTAGSAGLS